jgi:hypothetical protein
VSPRTAAPRGQVDQQAEADDRVDPLGAQLRPARRPGGGPDAVLLREATRMVGVVPKCRLPAAFAEFPSHGALTDFEFATGNACINQ